MLRHTLLGLSLALLVVGLACQGGRREAAPTTNPDGPGPPPAEAPTVTAEPDAPAVSVGVVEEDSFTGFAEDAFPPMLPGDEAHVGAWVRDDCLLCHEGGLSGAPVVEHAGMAEELLSAKCRTCHVALPLGTPAADAGAVLPVSEQAGDFAESAFPPTLPFDEAHQGAWMREDCLVCHETGIGTAPAVVHEGMAQLLLMARCRSCHVPSVPSGEADFGNPHRD